MFQNVRLEETDNGNHLVIGQATPEAEGVSRNIIERECELNPQLKVGIMQFSKYSLESNIVINLFDRRWCHPPNWSNQHQPAQKAEEIHYVFIFRENHLASLRHEWDWDRQRGGGGNIFQMQRNVDLRKICLDGQTSDECQNVILISHLK